MLGLHIYCISHANNWRDICNFVGFLWALRALGMGGCKLVYAYIGIVYILPTIGDIFVFCRVYIDIIYAMTTIGYWLYHSDTWIMENSPKDGKDTNHTL